MRKGNIMAKWAGRALCTVGLHRWRRVRVITKVDWVDWSPSSGLYGRVQDSEMRTICRRNPKHIHA